MKKYRFHIIIGSLFVLAGLLLMSDSILSAVRTANAMPSQIVPGTPIEPTDSNTSEAKANAQPVAISSSAVQLSVAIRPGYYDVNSQTWTLTNDAAYFAAMTTPPNTAAGSTYIYGHDTNEVFHPLNDLQTGETVTIKTSDGTKYVYALQETHDLSPNDSSWLRSQPDKPQLVLQTCAGLWSQYRRVFIFDLVGA